MGPREGSPQGSMAEPAGDGGGWSREKRPACFLGANDEEFGEAVTRLLLGPDVFVAFVLAGVLKQQCKGCQGARNPMNGPRGTWICDSYNLTDGLSYVSPCHIPTSGHWTAGRQGPLLVSPSKMLSPVTVIQREFASGC